MKPSPSTRPWRYGPRRGREAHGLARPDRLGRDERAVQWRFGQPEGAARQGRIWTWRGRAFLDDAAEVLILRWLAAAEAAGLWLELGSDRALLDAEIMPWSAKAGSLIDGQYAPVGEAARMGLGLAHAALDRTAARLSKASVLAALVAGRRDRAARCDAAWRGYVWDAPRPEDLRVAPFHMLASEGAVHMDRSHDWHTGWNARLSGMDEPVLKATECHLLNASDEVACQGIAAWWEGRTAAGGRGHGGQAASLYRPRSQGAPRATRPQGARARLSSDHLRP